MNTFNLIQNAAYCFYFSNFTAGQWMLSLHSDVEASTAQWSCLHWSFHHWHRDIVLMANGYNLSRYYRFITEWYHPTTQVKLQQLVWYAGILHMIPFCGVWHDDGSEEIKTIIMKEVAGRTPKEYLQALVNTLDFYHPIYKYI